METIIEPIASDFHRIWQENGSELHPAIAAGWRALTEQQQRLRTAETTVGITDVTLRDGQQQRTDTVTIADRVAVFDSIVASGASTIEIGHLGNGNGDQQLAEALIGHIAERQQRDERYGQVKLQVLFGSQQELIEEGIGVLERAFRADYGDNWQDRMSDTVVVHVYDRIDDNLRRTSSTPYTAEGSAERIASAARHALGAGLKHFSISGEGATAVSPEEAIQFYRAITTQLFSHGAESVNVNLANTFGYATSRDWNAASLTIFNTAVKHGFDGHVTTSIHTHNDTSGAIDFTMAALVAGFDKVEGTHIGMGERAGNVATVDVIARILEQARHAIDDENREPERRSYMAHRLGVAGVERTVRLDPFVAASLSNYHQIGESIAAIFGPHARYRWERTAIGSPYAHDNGSGPHDQAMAAAIVDPLRNPPYRNYEWLLAIAHIMGKNGMVELATGDPEAIDKVTVGNHAGGGKTRMIKQGTLKRAQPEAVDEARRRFHDYVRAIVARAIQGVAIISL